MTDTGPRPHEDCPSTPDTACAPHAASVAQPAVTGEAPAEVPTRTLHVGGDLDHVVLVPYLLGFHPHDSLVAIGVRGRRVAMTVRLDLPADEQAATQPAFTQSLRSATARIAEIGTAAIVIGYGSANRVGLALAPFTDTLHEAGLDLLRTLRVDQGRFYCLDPDCEDSCPAEGTPYDEADSPIPAEMVLLGEVALPDREAVEAMIAPVGGPDRDRSRAATDAAARRLIVLLPPQGATDTQPPELPDAVLQLGQTAIEGALRAAAAGQALSDEDAAWLTLLLTLPPIEDEAFYTCDGSHAQQQLWIDLTRRADSRLAAAPAFLLAINAYLAGNGAVATIALQRALRADPGYRMAHLFAEAMHAGITPADLRTLLTS